MPYPWPSFGGFNFQRDERATFESDAGWALAPSYDRQRPFGTATDVITALSIGSAERTFECYLAPNRFAALLTMLNSRAVLTDWQRPIPDSRAAFMTECTPLGDSISSHSGRSQPPSPSVTLLRKLHVRLTFVSA